jgi:hypothetical protein
MIELGLSEGDIVRLGNARGEIRLHVRASAGATRCVIVSEGLWDNRDFIDGRGVNTLTGADSVAPFGGAAFHDVRVWARADAEGAAQGAKAAAEEATQCASRRSPESDELCFAPDDQPGRLSDFATHVGPPIMATNTADSAPVPVRRAVIATKMGVNHEASTIARIQNRRIR